MRYGPDTAARYLSVRLLNNAIGRHWKATWGSEFRVIVREGGVTENTIHRVRVPSTKGA